MKEIKAYVRLMKVDEVLTALVQAGVPGFTAVEVKGFGSVAIPERLRYSSEFSSKVSPLIKLELVCKKDDLTKIVELIKNTAYTGHDGDGVIIVHDVAYVVEIKTGTLDSDNSES